MLLFSTGCLSCVQFAIIVFTLTTSHILSAIEVKQMQTSQLFGHYINGNVHWYLNEIPPVEGISLLCHGKELSGSPIPGGKYGNALQAGRLI